MKPPIYDEVFEAFFAEKIQPYKDQIAEAKAETRKVKAETRKVKAETRKVEAKIREMEAEAREAETRAKITEEFVYSAMYESICHTLCDSGKVEQVPNDVVNRIGEVRSYPLLRKLLLAAASPKSDYAEFLETLDKGE